MNKVKVRFRYVLEGEAVVRDERLLFKSIEYVLGCFVSALEKVLPYTDERIIIKIHKVRIVGIDKTT